LNAVVEILRRAQQENLPCLLVGGHAVILYQIPRFTRDIDFLVPDEAVQPWVDFLQRLQYRIYHRADAFVQLEPAVPGSLPPTRRAGASDWSDIFDLLRTCEIDLKDPEFQNLVVQFGGDEALDRMQREMR
jgi:hypothetical protein